MSCPTWGVKEASAKSSKSRARARSALEPIVGSTGGSGYSSSRYSMMIVES